ncbi:MULTISPECIES: heme o synthase [unclassified Simplicispira]|uniref:heme o synthase n=1 Tax=unclassified Simplicispira TaxID=2630407 RepID=UPI000D5E6FFE|nr:MULTISPECIES: heme o synthase [unclassified Simplicispira]MBH1977606.1 protoheme IX farnesyltransferase [Comamonadaceae bacterium]PVY57817.1 protoheme IX farnesyltransferase [Simplicispira sp. 125]REG18761.1 protoheme IX farnesyltransferase [Simplicispira sp. 110]
MHTTTLHPAGRSAAQLTRDVISLFKLRIGVLIMITALVGMAVSPGPAPGLAQVLVLALSVLVASASAGAFNQYVEHESDRLMARTRKRAFVTGALPHHPAWLVLMAVLLAGAVAAAWLVLNAAAALYVFLGAFFYGVVYTLWLKRRTALNIVIGGLAGSFAVLAGAAAIDPGLGPLPVLLALVLFLWTPPHFWSLAIANKTDYADAGVPMLPVVVGTERAARIVLGSTVALFVASLLPLGFGAGPVYAVGALAGGLHFVHKSWLLVRQPSRSTAMGSFFASLIQLSVLLVAACIDAFMR